MKKRILWIDALKFFAIILVVWGHVLFRMADIPEENKYLGLAGLIYSFHMPLFMVLSGYVSSSIIIGKGDIVRKFRQLIIPCISLAIICYIISFDENFWYLKSLFLCYVLWLFYFRINIKFKLVLFVISCFVLFPLICYIPYLSSYKVDFMLPFFGLGLLLHRCSGFIECKIKKILIISCLLFVLCEIIWDPQFIWYNSRPSWINFKEIYVNHVLSFNLYNLCLNLFRFFTGAIASLFL